MSQKCMPAQAFPLSPSLLHTMQGGRHKVHILVLVLILSVVCGSKGVPGTVYKLIIIINTIV